MSQSFFNLPVVVVFEKFMDNSSFAEETHNPFYNVWLFLHLVGDSFQKVMQSCPLTFLAYTNSQKHCDYIFQHVSL